MSAKRLALIGLATGTVVAGGVLAGAAVPRAQAGPVPAGHHETTLQPKAPHRAVERQATPRVNTAVRTVHLVCSGRGTATTTPALDTTARPVTVSGTGTLDHCVSPDGTRNDIKSGRLRLKGSGWGTCTSGGGKGTLIFDWYAGDRQSGRLLGRSVMADEFTATPGEWARNGTVSRGSHVFPGENVAMSVLASYPKCSASSPLSTADVVGASLAVSGSPLAPDNPLGALS
ncbi:hypothetical protein ACSNOK_19270 [Streptomyces sp. URMC 126]|uniref:hypothetical protein n=1 Tax=Streptomyces sp. URMC 126 TaxID=3423401 RepID=UPI003F1A5A91